MSLSTPAPVPTPPPDAAFEAAFHTHAAELCEFAYGYLRSRDLAAELVQDVFLRLWSRRHTISEIEDLRVYLLAATRNAAFDALRHRRIEERWEERSRSEGAPFTVGRVPGAAEQLEAQELDAAIEHAVNRLPERARQAFILRWRHHLSYAQIAETMGISVKAVEIHRMRALKTLRKALAAWLP